VGERTIQRRIHFSRTGRFTEIYGAENYGEKIYGEKI